MLTDAKAVILPLQDIFGLDDDARMNVPGVAVGNWKWQADAEDFDKYFDMSSNKQFKFKHAKRIVIYSLPG